MTAVAVKEDMAELNKIISELKDLNLKGKELRNRKKELEVKILEYLEESESPGLKYKELVVLKSETTIHMRKKKKEKEESIISVLEENGVSDAKALYDAITKAMVGEESTKVKLRVKSTVPELF